MRAPRRVPCNRFSHSQTTKLLTPRSGAADARQNAKALFQYAKRGTVQTAFQEVARPCAPTASSARFEARADYGSRGRCGAPTKAIGARPVYRIVIASYFDVINAGPRPLVSAETPLERRLTPNSLDRLVRLRVARVGVARTVPRAR